MSKVYCKSNFDKLEREFKIERLKENDPSQPDQVKRQVTASAKKPAAIRVVRALSGLWQIIKNPWLLNLVLDNEELWRKRVVKKYGLKNGLPLIDIEDLFPELDEVVSPYAFLDGGCLPTDLVLLRALAKKNNALNYLEIGTWRGESVANVAPLVQEAVTLNLSDDDMRARGLTEDYIENHRIFSGHIPNVKHLHANSLDFDFGSLKKTFQLIFVDGDHHYEAVVADTAGVLKALQPETGIIVWHDYARTPEHVRWSVLAGILDGLPTSMHKHLYHISNTLCAAYLPNPGQNIYPDTLKASNKPRKFFEVTLKMVKLTNYQ